MSGRPTVVTTDYRAANWLVAGGVPLNVVSAWLGRRFLLFLVRNVLTG